MLIPQEAGFFLALLLLEGEVFLLAFPAGILEEDSRGRIPPGSSSSGGGVPAGSPSSYIHLHILKECELNFSVIFVQ